MKTPVYLDYHSTTPCAPEVIDAMSPYFTADHLGNAGAKSHALGRKAAAVMAQAREQVAALINAVPEGITFTSGATESNNLALLGLAAAAPENRREIVISAIEHDCVSKTAAQLAQRGFTVKTVPVTADGFVIVGELAKAVTDETLVVSLIAASHEIGTIQPLKAAADIAHAKGALLHSDATQAVGKIPLDIQALGVDLLSFSAHKFYGPAGIGALYARVKPPVAISPVFFGGAQQGLRPGTVPLPLVVGFGAACRLAGIKMQTEGPRVRALADLLLQKLQLLNIGAAVNGSRDNCLPGLLNLRFIGMDAQDLMLELQDDLCLSTGAACASAARKPSAVLKAIGLSNEDVAGSLRFSLGRGTTEEEIIFAAAKLGTAAARLAAKAA